MSAGPEPFAPRARLRLTRAIRRHPLGAFVAWFFTVGWAVGFVPVVAEAAFGVELPFQPFAIATTLVGGLLPALVVTRVVGGRAAVRDLTARTLRWRTPIGWYAVAVLALPVPATALAVLAFGEPDATQAALAAALAGGFVVQTAVTLVTINLAEEVVWMGFVQARLQTTHRPLRAAVLTSVLFMLQHLPLFAVNDSSLVVIVPAFLLLAIPFRALVGWVYNRTGSLLVVGLLHAASNGATGGSNLGAWSEGLLPRLYDSDAVGMFHLLAAVPVGLAVIVATRGRLGLPGGGDAPGRSARARARAGLRPRVAA